MLYLTYYYHYFKFISLIFSCIELSDWGASALSLTSACSMKPFTSGISRVCLHSAFTSLSGAGRFMFILTPPHLSMFGLCMLFSNEKVLQFNATSILLRCCSSRWFCSKMVLPIFRLAIVGIISGFGWVLYSLTPFGWSGIETTIGCVGSGELAVCCGDERCKTGTLSCITWTDLEKIYGTVSCTTFSLGSAVGVYVIGGWRLFSVN